MAQFITTGNKRKADYQELYQMPIASDDDYDKYVQKLSKLWKMSKGRQPYLDALAKTLFIINKKMGIYDGVNDKEDLKKELYEKYLFWANLSFCNSQNVKNRSFWEAKNISCNVLSEEIPNCLHKGFLKKILNCLKPDIALVFGKYIDPITILKELLGVTPELNQLKSEKHTAHKRNKIDVNVELTTYVPSNQSDIKTKFIFLPHPRFPWNGNCREKAIEWACSMLINIQ